MVSHQKQAELFGFLLEKLDLEKSELKAPGLPILDFGEKNPELPPATGDDNLGKGSIKNIFEVLGFFTTKNPGRVYLATKTIYDYCKRNSTDIVLISEIVYIHECAHYIHYALNPKDFLLGRLPPIENSRKFYVETFAQLCTWAVCVELGKEYKDIFCLLNKNQSDEYKHFKKYCKSYKEVITNTFLKQNLSSDFNTVIRDEDEKIDNGLDELLRDMIKLSLANRDKKLIFTRECPC